MPSEGTPEDFARMAASLRGGTEPDAEAEASGKTEANRALVEALHPEPEQDSKPEDVDYVRLFAPKPGHIAVVSALHGIVTDEDPAE